MRKVWIYTRRNIRGWRVGWYESDIRKAKALPAKALAEHYRHVTTMPARSGDPFAVQRLLGHVDLTMATRYIQDVSEQTDMVIENSRTYAIRGEDVV